MNVPNPQMSSKMTERGLRTYQGGRNHADPI